MCRKTIRAVFAALALASPAPAVAQVLQSGLLTLPYHVFDATGGAVLAGGNFSLQASMGQITGTGLSGGAFTMVSGIFGIRPSARLDLETLHVFPSPYRPSRGDDRITFRGTTTHTRIRIYTLSGWLVRTLEKNDSTTQDIVWQPVVNSAGQGMASGVYHYVAEGDEVGRKTGKLMIIK
ncbi:MAG: T9SS type A sorting domain-containing protein [Elusimicrobia bacterium]|nr:T9SS type A sorting domain-containing protein [Elusimicrobiota bacterium]